MKIHRLLCFFSQKRVQKHHGSELGNAADGHEDSVLTIVSNVILKQIYGQICHHVNGCVEKNNYRGDPHGVTVAYKRSEQITDRRIRW